MRVVDLSKPVEANPNDPFFMRVCIKHKRHQSSRFLIRLLGLPFRLFPSDFNGWADDTITKLGVHATTHIDAPWHYGATCNGARAPTIDEIPLDRCIGPGLVLDLTHKLDNHAITVSDMEKALTKANAVITDQTIVLIHTGRDRLIGTRDYWKKGTGMSAAATEWLLDHGVTVAGIDQWGWDLPLWYQAKTARETNDGSIFWEAHRVGQRRPFWHMEQLVNLGRLPPKGFEVAVFPLKITGASAAPARVVALLR